MKTKCGLACLLAATAAMATGGCWGPEAAAPPAPPAKATILGPQGESALDGLLDLMRERLMLMHEVARWKWNEGKPIVDRDREQQLLDDLEQRGLNYGLSRQRTREFMVAQIEAGKLIQEADFAAWREKGQGKFTEARDLTTDLRPLIDRLSDRLLLKLSQLSPESAALRSDVEERAEAVLHGAGIDDTVKKVAIQPLLDGS